MTGDKLPDHSSPHQPAAASQIADQAPPSYRSAQARRIFSKIEKLAFDAIREDLRDEVDAIIDNHMEKGPKKTTSDHTVPHPLQDLANIKKDEHHIIRDLISSQVREVLEEEAPAMIRRILASALLPPQKRP